MKTCLHIITGLKGGGAETVLFRLCTHDRSMIHRVISLSDGGKYGPLLEAAGIEVTCLGMTQGRVSLGVMVRLWRAIRASNADVVQTWMYHANLLGGVASRVAGQRNVYWGIRQSNLDPAQTSRNTLRVDRLCARLSSTVPRRIICCAEAALTAHAERGYDRRRMLVIANGYNLSAIQPDPAAREATRQEFGIARETPVLGFVARHHPYKDHPNLLKALSILQDMGVRPTCLLVGEGMDPSNTQLLAEIEALGLKEQVLLLGPRDDVPAVMNALDLHVMSSATEGFPNVLAEAMACGTPCISTDVGDAAQIVGSTGAIVPPRDPSALARAISDLLIELNSTCWKSRQLAARSRIVDRLSIHRMIESYHSVWFGEEQSDQAHKGILEGLHP